MRPIQIVVYKGNKRWLAALRHHSLIAAGDSPDDALDGLIAVMRAHIETTGQSGAAAFDGLPEPPLMVRERFTSLSRLSPPHNLVVQAEAGDLPAVEGCYLAAA